MFRSTVEVLNGGQGRRLTVHAGGSALAAADAIRGWAADPDFRSHFISDLAACPYRAFFMRTAGVAAPCPPAQAGLRSVAASRQGIERCRRWRERGCAPCGRGRGGGL